MIGLLRADWRKLRHRRMPYVLVLILIAIVTLVFSLISSRARFRGEMGPPDALIIALTLSAGFAAFIWPVLAGSWAGGEYGWGTIRMALTREPSRIAFSLSGLIMVLLTVGFGQVLVLIVGAVAGSIVASVNHLVAPVVPAGTSVSGVVVSMFFATWYASAFYAVLAYTAGVVFRSAPAGVGVGIGFSVAQTAVRAIFIALGDPWSTIAQHFPDSYTTALTGRVGNLLVARGPFARVSSSSASIQISIIGIAVYIAILLAVMLTTVRLRDIDL